MATVDERSLGVARLYARAMLAVARERGASQSLADEFEGVLEHAAGDADFERFLSSPVLERERRRDSLEKMLRGRSSDLLVDSLQVINQKGRLDILEQILAAYREAHRELLGQVEVKIATAVELTEEQRADFRERASRFTGKEAFLVEEVNPDLLGGLVVRIGDQKVDMSVRRDLELLSSRFAQRLSSELLSKSDFAIESDVTVEAADGSHDGRDEEE